MFSQIQRIASRRPSCISDEEADQTPSDQCVARHVRVLGASAKHVAYLYVDSLRGQDRLNIFSHGIHRGNKSDSESTPAGALIGKILLNGQELAELVMEEFDQHQLKSYRHIRLLICHSGCAGDGYESIVTQFARSLPPGHLVTGFRGEVILRRRGSEWNALQKRAAEMLAHGDSRQAINAWLMDQQRRGRPFTIHRVRFAMPWSESGSHYSRAMQAESGSVV